MDPPDGGMRNANNREAMIEAKIAKIRAQNKALEKRHAEVERDKQQSGQGKVAGATQTRHRDQEEEQHPFRNPYSQQRSQQQQQQQPRRSAQARLSRDSEQPSPSSSFSSRLPPGRPDSGPPPDPGYRFLADRMRDGSDPDLHNGGGGGSVYDPDLDQDDRSSVHSSCSSYSQRGRRMRRRRRRSGSCHSNRGGPADRSGGYRGGRGRSRNPSGGQEPARRPGSRDRNRYYDRESYGDRGRGRGRGWDPPSRGGGGERGRGRGRESFGTHDDWPEEDRFGGGHRNSSRNHNEDLRRDSNRDRPRNLDAYPSEWERERGPSHSRGGRNSYRGGRNHWEEEDGKKGPRQDYGNYHRGRNDENRSPRQEQSAGDGRHPLRRPTGEDWSEDRVGNVLKEIRHGPGPSRPPPAPMSSAQARLERARNSPRVSSQQANVDLGPVGKEKEKSPSIPRGEGLDWTCGDPGCGWANVSEAEKCEKCHLTYQETIELTAQKDTNRRVCSDRETLRVEVKFDRTLSPDQENTLDELQPSVASQPATTTTTNTSSHFPQSQPQQQQLWQKPQMVTNPNSWIDQSQMNATTVLPVSANQQWQQEPQEDDWRNAPPIGNWADEVDATPDHSPQIVNWDPQQTQYQQQPPASGVYGTYAETMAVSVGVAESDYIQQQQQQMVYQQQQQQAAEAAVAQQAQQYLIPFQQPAPQAYPIPSVPPTMTQLTHAGNPHGIMTPHQQPQAYVHPNHQPHQQYYQDAGYNNNSYDDSYQQHHPSQRGNTSSSSYRGRGGHHYSSRGRGESYYYNNGGSGSSYRSKIPPRFQKQRTSDSTKTSKFGNSKYSSSNLHRHLPLLGGSNVSSLPKTPPETCNRLTVLANDSVIEILTETELEKTLKIPVQLVAVNGTKQLEQGLKKIDPSLDRILLFHLLDDDALEISSTSKSDVDKGVDSDNAANELCDLIDTLAAKIPYVKILLSKLLPRFDLEGEKTGMSVPNNVRKVMNVQLVLRTHKYAKASDKDLAKKVTILDNEGLEWMDNEVKMLRVMKMNGRELTAFGRSQLLESWTKVLKQCVSGEGLQPSGSSDSVTASPPSLELTEEKEKTVCSPSLRRPNPSAPAKSDAPVPEPGKEKEQGLQDLEKPEDVPLPEDEAISPSEESPVKPENHKLPSEPATPESVSDKPSESVDNVLEPSSVAPAVKETEDLQKPEVVEAESTEILDVPATARKSASPQEEFHEAEDGGFIEDSYVSSSAAASKEEDDESQLPSLGSLTIGDVALARAVAAAEEGGGQDDSGPASGIFIEDSYVDASGTGLEEFKEKENDEMMEKELANSREEEVHESEKDVGTTSSLEVKAEAGKTEASVKEE